MPAIKSPEEFQEKLKEGDQFWLVTYQWGKPIKPSGPYTILEFDQNQTKVTYEIELEKGSLAQVSYLSDLVRSPRVFLSEEEAHAFFENVIEAFEKNSKAQHQYRLEKTRHDEFVRQLWGDLV